MREPPTIDSFGAGGFRVSGAWRQGSLLLLDDKVFDWRPTTLADIAPDDLAAVFEAGTAVSEFILLGTGAEQALPPKAIRDAARAAGLGFEFMATPAAARTYGPLASQGRRVAVALIAL
jgi:uncharacterized protein